MTTSDRNPALCTPLPFIQFVRSFFNGVIDLDPCPNHTSHVGANRNLFRPEHDGLQEPWGAYRIFVNPPWGYDYTTDGMVLEPWLRKCAGEAMHGAEIITLVPTAPGSELWREHVFAYVKAICFVDTVGRTPIYLVKPDGTIGDDVPVSLLYYGHRVDRFAHGEHPRREGGFVGFNHLGSVWRPA